MTLPSFAVAQCGCMDEELSVFPKTTGSTLLSVSFLQVALSHTPSLRVLELHINGVRGITMHITEWNWNDNN